MNEMDKSRLERAYAMKKYAEKLVSIAEEVLRQIDLAKWTRLDAAQNQYTDTKQTLHEIQTDTETKWFNEQERTIEKDVMSAARFLGTAMDDELVAARAEMQAASPQAWLAYDTAKRAVSAATAEIEAIEQRWKQ